MNYEVREAQMSSAIREKEELLQAAKAELKDVRDSFTEYAGKTELRLASLVKWQKECTAVNEQNVMLRTDMAALHTRYTNVSERCEILSVTVTRREKRIDELTEIIQDLEAKIKDMRVDMMSMVDRLDNDVGLADKLADAEETVENLYKKLSDRDVYIRDLSGAVSNYELRINELSAKPDTSSDEIKKLSSIISNNQIQINELSAKLAAAENVASHLSFELSTSEAVTSDISAKLDVSENMYTDVSAKLAASEGVAGRLSSELLASKAVNSDLSAKLASLEEKYKEVQSGNQLAVDYLNQYSDQDKQLQQVTNKLAAAESRIAGLTKQLADAESKSTEWSKRHATTESRAVELTKKLSSAESRATEWSKRHATAELKTAELTRKLTVLEQIVSDMGKKAEIMEMLNKKLTSKLSDKQDETDNAIDRCRQAENKIAQLTSKLSDTEAADERIAHLTAECEIHMATNKKGFALYETMSAECIALRAAQEEWTIKSQQMADEIASLRTSSFDEIVAERDALKQQLETANQINKNGDALITNMTADYQALKKSTDDYIALLQEECRTRPLVRKSPRQPLRKNYAIDFD